MKHKPVLIIVTFVLVFLAARAPRLISYQETSGVINLWDLDKRVLLGAL